MPPRKQKEHVESISSYGFSNIQASYNLSYTVVSANVLQLQYESLGKYSFFSSSIFSSCSVYKLDLCRTLSRLKQFYFLFRKIIYTFFIKKWAQGLICFEGRGKGGKTVLFNGFSRELYLVPIIFIHFWGCPHGVMVKAMVCRIVVREFVLQSCSYVHFWANNLGKGMNPLILPAMA